ncbi:MAG: endonuclease V [Candidatus Omnitrophica bacterium]|nr:endonuclease V [Candidatus Omnitrophota bacterium]MCM8808789.1 endonuclease V [Candidatus Omnitrophota bacterium]MCM8810059.1 endonuclease V [Candidatus Omnitrophota bacterium]
MEVKKLHRWDVDKDEGEKIQEQLRKKVIIKPIPKKINIVCGIDSSYKEDEIISCAVLCKYPELEIIDIVKIKGKTNFPYIKGLLAFREGENITKLIEKIEKDVDCFILNGHGIAHPKKIGLASHIGVLIEKPTIGCAKSLLYGNYSEPPSFPLSSTFIKDEEGEIIGHALRNYNNGIIFISPGHLIDLKDTLTITINCIKKEYSLPVPLYLAHINSKSAD